MLPFRLDYLQECACTGGRNIELAVSRLVVEEIAFVPGQNQRSISSGVAAIWIIARCIWNKVSSCKPEKVECNIDYVV
jgi:hypothetical protein